MSTNLPHVFCTDCGTKNKTSSKFCFKCGCRLQKQVVSTVAKRYEIIDLVKEEPVKEEQLDQNQNNRLQNIQLPQLDDGASSVSTPYFITNNNYNHSQQGTNDTASIVSTSPLSDPSLSPLFPPLSSLRNRNVSETCSSPLQNVIRSQPVVPSPLSTATRSFVLNDDSTQSVRNTAKRKPSDKEELDENELQNNELICIQNDAPFVYHIPDDLRCIVPLSKKTIAKEQDVFNQKDNRKRKRSTTFIRESAPKRQKICRNGHDLKPVEGHCDLKEIYSDCSSIFCDECDMEIHYKSYHCEPCEYDKCVECFKREKEYKLYNV